MRLERHEARAEALGLGIGLDLGLGLELVVLSECAMQCKTNLVAFGSNATKPCNIAQ